MRKTIFILIDGLGDLPYNGKTALDAAKTPNLDQLMQNGNSSYGLMNSIGIGIIPGSDTSQMNMLGYAPKKYYPGRGPLEALGANMDIKDGEIAFRANFGTVDENFVVLDRRAGRLETEIAHLLEESIREIKIDDYTFRFKATKQHRGVVVVEGPNLVPIGDTDPHKIGERVLQPAINEHNKEFVKAVNKYSAEVHRILSKHPLNKDRDLPANILLLRGAGQYRKIISFNKKYNMKALCIADYALYKGITRYIGIDTPELKFDGDFKNRLKQKVEYTKKYIYDYDFIYLHIKETDNKGHDGKFIEKVKIIESIDKYLISELMKLDSILIITGDHSTPALLKEHSFEPVPFVIGNVIARDYGAKKFCEVECRKGELGIFDGDKVMNLVMAYNGKTKKYGS